jgi:hypothetical protein
MNHPRYLSSAAHKFSTLDDMPFAAMEYSYLKFGSDRVAKKFGYELAEHTFQKHSEILMTNQCVVIPSPFNFVPNAATIMAEHFTARLNQLLVHANGSHAEWSIIHRKVSYTNDYGFLPKEKRRALIDNDEFYLNRGFLGTDKVLLFIDDVKITGTHEDKLIDVLENHGVQNPAIFLYYAQHEFTGTGADIEAKINFAGIKTVADYVRLAKEPHHHLIVRPIKFMLSADHSDFMHLIEGTSHEWKEKLYNACIGEGYYKIPLYQHNFATLAAYIKTPNLVAA